VGSALADVLVRGWANCAAVHRQAADRHWRGWQDVRVSLPCDTTAAGGLSHVPRASRRAAARSAGLVRSRPHPAPPGELVGAVSRRVPGASRDSIAAHPAAGAAVVLRNATVWTRQTRRRAVRSRETGVRNTAISNPLSRLD